MLRLLLPMHCQTESFFTGSSPPTGQNRVRNRHSFFCMTLAGMKKIYCGKANVIAIRGLFDYQPGFSFLGTKQEFVPTEPCFIDRADRISRLFNWAAKEYNLDPAKTVVFGSGDGATLAITLLFVHSELLGGAVLIRPKSPFRPKPLPALPCYPILLINPKNESRDERAASETLAETLFDCGCSVRKVRVPANAHFDEKVIKAIRAWYKKVSATDISIECAL